jgi:hypothetical protein
MKSKVLAALYAVEQIRGNNAKKAKLAEFANDNEVKEAVKFLLDDLVTGISTKKWEAHFDGKKAGFPDFTKVTSLHELFNYLHENNTGTDADIETAVRFAKTHDPQSQEIIEHLVTKRYPTLGIGVTFANDVFPGLIQEFAVILADKYFDDPEYWNDKTFSCQTKLDGMRMVAIKDHGKVTLTARSGKDLTGQFPEIENDIRSIPMDNFVLDGERMPVGFKSLSSNEAFKKVSNGTTKGEKIGYCLAVYDYVPLKDWNARHCNMTYSERNGAYNSLLLKNKKPIYNHLYPLELEYVGTDEKQIVRLLEIAKANKQEGIIVKDMDAMYEWDRCKAIVKVKSFFDIDVVIEGWEKGSGKNKDRCGSLYFTYKGNKVNVGSGLTDEQRIDIATNFDKNWKGKTMEVVYFEETTNSKGTVSLRFPKFKTLKTGD